MDRHPLPNLQGRPALACLLSFMMAAIGVVTAEAEGVYVVSHGTLYAFDVDSGAAQSIGPTGLARVEIYDMTLGPDGQLYGFGISAGTYGLYEIDPHTGSGTAIGPLTGLGSSEIPSALAFDASGQLWLTAGSSLYRVETATAVPTLIADLDREVMALAALGDELYAMTVTPPDSNGLEVIDLDALELQPRFDLPDIREFIWDATFDSRGRLRILAQGASILSNVALLFYEADVSTGEVEERHRESYHFTQALAGIRNLASPRILAPSPIPALDTSAMVLLAALLLAAALSRVARLKRT